VTGPGLEASVTLAHGLLDLDADLNAGAGEVVALVGPNGAGKTTLLRALAGLTALDGGRVVLDGTVLEDIMSGTYLPPERRPIGVAFQDYALFPHLSALENVAFGPRSRGVPKGAARTAAAGWLDRVGLGNRAGARPAELSGGQAQRVALARALAAEPRLLLLDEPLAALDATSRVETRRWLTRHLDGFGGATVVVTHDPVEAMALAGRLVVLDDGRVVQSGTPAELREHPRSRYVADLVGVNLFRGTAGDGRVRVAPGVSLVAPDAGRGDVLALVHPRAVALHRRPPEGTPRNVWEGVAEGLDREGDRVRVRVGGQLPVVAEVTAAAAEELGLAAGGTVWVSIKATEIDVVPA